MVRYWLCIGYVLVNGWPAIGDVLAIYVLLIGYACVLYWLGMG